MNFAGEHSSTIFELDQLKWFCFRNNTCTDLFLLFKYREIILQNGFFVKKNILDLKTLKNSANFYLKIKNSYVSII